LNILRLGLLGALLCASSFAQTAGLMPMPRQQFLDNNAHPLTGGKLYSYAAGTNTMLATYTDASGLTPNSNPTVLDAGGFASIWLKSQAYKIVLTDVNGGTIWTADSVANDGLAVAALRCTPSGVACLDASGWVPQSELNYNQGGAGAVNRSIQNKLQELVSMEDFAGADCGAKINSAYAALPAAGGTIQMHTSCSFSTPINFGTANKPVTLQGSGRATTLTYTGSSGTAITINNGIVFDLSTSLRDVVLTGPGNATPTIGVLVGGTNGAVGWSVEHVVIQSFGAGFKTGSNQWVGHVSQSMIRDNSVNVLMPSGVSQAGENIQFNHVVFADAPPPYTNSVWIQNGEVEFTDCSFDSAQVRIGNGTTSSVKATIIGAHFENPNYVWDPTNYDMLVEDAHAGNSLTIMSSHVEQDKPTSGPAEFFRFGGGKVHIEGLSSYSPGGSPLTNLAILSGAVNIDVYNYNDMAGNITGSLLGGSTTGFVVNFSGADTGSGIPRNFVIRRGNTTGGAAFDMEGSIRAFGGQLISGIATGTAPLIVNSTTPVQNLFAQPATYDSAGTQIIGLVHLVYGRVTLSGGSATVNLSGAAAYSSSSSFRCMANDEAGSSLARMTPGSGSSFTLQGNGSDNVSYFCIGN
jgi:hypothetical protein